MLDTMLDNMIKQMNVMVCSFAIMTFSDSFGRMIKNK